MSRQNNNSKDVHTFINESMTQNFLKLAMVNIKTGEFMFAKQSMELRDEGYEDITNIYTYIKKQVDDKMVLSEYAADYLKYSDPEYVQKRVFSGEKRIIQSYKRRAGDDFLWVTFSIVVPDDCSEDNPWVVFSWREADTDTITMIDALVTLSVTYYKILRINVEKDTFEVIKAEPSEHEHARRLNKISHWWKHFADDGNVYEEDLDVYNAFTDIEKIRDHFRESDTRISCRYRRRRGDNFFWAQMELVPSIEYSDKNPVLILYVKDVHEEYLAEQSRHQRLVDNFNRDALTKLYNRHKFNEDIENLRMRSPRKLSCLYIDVNGLHEVNNHLGHRKGDDMLCAVADALKEYFPNESKYRIGGDEFTVLSENLSNVNIRSILSNIRSDLGKDNYEISAGVEYSDKNIDVDRIVGSAELKMRKDKECYYKNDDNKRRERAMNEELEKMITEKNDADSFIDAISTAYARVYLVDLKVDTPRNIYIPRYFKMILKEENFCYSAALKAYADKFVKKEYHENFDEVIDYDNLIGKLRNEGVIEFKFQKIDNEYMVLRILELENTDDDKFETIWIFSRV